MEDFIIKKLTVVIETDKGDMLETEVTHLPHAFGIAQEVLPKYPSIIAKALGKEGEDE